MLIGRTLAESRKLGPIITPKQYQCSYCATGVCAIVVNVIQCYCGNTQCAPAPTTRMLFTFMNTIEKKMIFSINFFLFSTTKKSMRAKSL